MASHPKAGAFKWQCPFLWGIFCLGQVEISISPGTLEPILARMFREYWPVLEKVTSAVSKWIDDNPNSHEIPRMIGMHSFSLGDTTSEQMTLPYSQWMLQRVLDHYQQLTIDQKPVVDEFLEKLQVGQAMDIKLQHRVERENNLLVPA